MGYSDHKMNRKPSFIKAVLAYFSYVLKAIQIRSDYTEARKNLEKLEQTLSSNKQ
jgi:hypothetical protein